MFLSVPPPSYSQTEKQFRIVFNGSLKGKDASLNDGLRKGPDLTNSLVGVLLRFRLENCSVVGDIEKMFHQIRLTDEDKDVHRFFWFDNNDLTKPPSVFRMKVHIFGAVSSPSIANFALKSVPKQMCLLIVSRP